MAVVVFASLVISMQASSLSASPLISEATTIRLPAYIEDEQALEADTVGEILEGLAGRPGAMAYEERGGWYRVEVFGESTRWRFTSSSHGAHPAVIRYRYEQGHARSVLKTRVLCEGATRACSRILMTLRRREPQVAWWPRSELPAPGQLPEPRRNGNLPPPLRGEIISIEAPAPAPPPSGGPPRCSSVVALAADTPAQCTSIVPRGISYLSPPLEAFLWAPDAVVRIHMAVNHLGEVACLDLHQSGGHAVADRYVIGAVSSWRFERPNCAFPEGLEHVILPVHLKSDGKFRSLGRPEGPVSTDADGK